MGISPKLGVGMFPRVVFLTSLLALPTVAQAAGGDRIAANVYSSMLEHQLFAWHIWTTGVSRLDDGSLFGLASIVLAMAFGMSGVGIILFKERGLGFRGGWLLSLPVIVGSLILFTMFRPYPSARDVPTMLIVAALASLGALFVARLARGSVTEVVARPNRKAGMDKAVDDRRLKMAVRAPGGAKRGY